MSDWTNTITILKKDDARVWNMLKEHHQDLLDKREIGYIGMPSRKIFPFKDRAVLESFAEKLKAKKILHSIDNAFPDIHPFNK